MIRRLACLLAATVAAGVVASTAAGALFFLFQPTSAQSGDRIAIRLGGTPAGFTAADRVEPFGRPIRVYLVPFGVADEVRTRFDQRLSFAGQVVPDRDGHGLLRFSLPPLDSGRYVAAFWCPACGAHSAGRTFFVQSGDDFASRYRRQASLRVEMPDAGASCPVTRPNHVVPPRGDRGYPLLSYGNGFLSVHVSSDGGLVTERRDGTLFQKLAWTPRRGFGGTLTVRGERVDTLSSPMRVLGVHWGSSSTGRGGWASAVEFPSEGCWRISGRVGDISLSYVVRVIGV